MHAGSGVRKLLIALVAAFAVLAAAVAVLAVAVAFPAPRSALLKVAAATYLSTKGLHLEHLEHLDVSMSGGVLDAVNIAITEEGRPFFSSDRIIVDYGSRDRALGISRLEIDRPRLVVRRAADGSYDVLRLFGGGNGGAGAPLRLTLLVRDGSIALLNPYSPAAPGRALSVDRINLEGVIAQGATSHAGGSMMLDAARRSTPVIVRYAENDVSRVASATVALHGAPLAPIVDLLVSSNAFVVEDGSADLRLRAYAVGWNTGAAPQWHAVGEGFLRNGRLRTLPLAVPIRDVSGPIAVFDGTMEFPGLSAAANAVPMAGAGTISLFPNPMLGLRLNASGPLSRVRKWLPFSAGLPVGGRVAIAAAVFGQPADPHVDLELHALHELRYGSVPIQNFRTNGFYHSGHVALRDTFVSYAHASLYGYGDIDLTASPVSGQFVVVVQAPSRRLPWISDVDASGVTRAGASFSGPLMKLGGNGFAVTTGGEERVRAEVAATADRLTIDSIVTDPAGGELVASSALNRTGDRSAAFDVFARQFSLRLNGRSVSLPGVIRRPIGLPAATGTLTGYAALRGSIDAPMATVRLRASNVNVAGNDIGRVFIEGTGTSDSFRISRLAAAGPDGRVDAHGVVRMISGRGERASVAGALGGSAHLNFDAVRLPGTIRGRADGSFAGAFNGRSWLASLDLAAPTASISGVPVRGLRATIGQRSGGDITIYDATADAAGGLIQAVGSVPGASRGSLTVIARGVDLATLRAARLPLSKGVVVAVVRIEGKSSAPSITGAAALSGGSYTGSPVSGDTQASYGRGTLVLRGGRVVARGSAATVDGTVAGLQSGNPSMALDIAMPEGDLASLSGAFAPSPVALTGVASARIRASGSFANPAIAGEVSSDAGTMRGVAYGDMHATFSAAPGAMDVQTGSVRFGSSRIDVAGSIAQGATTLHASSQHVDLNDFNDFFDGKDVLAGHGSLDVAIATGPSRANASGFVRLRDSGVSGIPLGTLDGRFRPAGRGAAIDIRQRGEIARSVLAVSLVPDEFGRPVTVANGTISDLDLSKLATYVRAEDDGISGVAHASVHASGHARDFRGDVAFAVDRGRVRDTVIRQAAGRVSIDPRSIAVRDLRLAIDGAALQAQGTIDRTGRLRAHAVANVSNLSALGRFSKHPISMSGSVIANVDAAGTIARPTFHSVVRASMGQVQNVAFDSVSADASYARGKILASGDASLSDGHGDLRISANLPVRTKPFGIGPNDRALKLYARATGVGIASLNPLFADASATGGVLDGRFSVLGTAGKPVVSGALALRGVTVQSSFDKVPLTDLNADVALANDRIDLQRLHAGVGSGTLDVNGSAHIVPATALRPAPSLQYAFGARLHGADVNVPNYLTATLDAQLGLTKSGAVPYVFGDMTLTHTSVPFASILALASGRAAGPSNGATIPGLPPLRRNHIIVYGGSVFGDELDHVVRPTPPPARHPTLAIIPSSVALGMRVTAGDEVGVTGLLNVTGRGTIDVSGDTTNPRLSGTLTAVRGHAGFLNTSFDLLDGWLTFHPKEGVIPTVTADAITRTEDADITVSVYGRVDQLHTDMESDPPMDREAIIATLLRIPQLNSALASSHGQQQSAFGVSPENLVSGAVAGQILGALNVGFEQVFNLEEIDFGLDPFGRPQLELRKQVSPRAYTLYRTTFTVPPAEAFGIAYQVRRALQVEFTQSQTTPGILSTYALPQTSLTVKVTFH